jgi:hypothetical protein
MGCPFEQLPRGSYSPAVRMRVSGQPVSYVGVKFRHGIGRLGPSSYQLQLSAATDSHHSRPRDPRAGAAACAFAARSRSCR